MYNNLPLISTAYQLKTSYVQVANTPITVLPADVRRWAVRFTFAPVGGTTLFVMPHTLVIDQVSNLAIAIQVTNTLLVKFQDDPGAVGSEWLSVVTMGSNTNLRIDEYLFVGG